MSETVLEVVREYFPDASDEEVDSILWSRTGFPSFWSGDAETCLRRQLAEFKEALKLKVPLCDFCNEPRLCGHFCLMHDWYWRIKFLKGLLCAPSP